MAVCTETSWVETKCVIVSFQNHVIPTSVVRGQQPQSSTETYQMYEWNITYTIPESNQELSHTYWERIDIWNPESFLKGKQPSSEFKCHYNTRSNKMDIEYDPAWKNL